MAERLTDLLYAIAAENGSRPFLIFEERTFRYDEFARLVDALAAQLVDEGLGASDRVALICGNRPAYLVAWFALTEIGAVTVPVNHQLFGPPLATVLHHADVSLALLDDAFAAERATQIEEMGYKVLVVGASAERLGNALSRRVRKEAAGSASLNSILFTSGTTGAPKGAMISNRSFLASGEDMVRALGINHLDRIMVVLPLFHANPQMYGVMSVLQAGATLVLVRKFSASRFFDQAKEAQATGFTYVGTILNILLKLQGPEPAHSLRWCTGGGAPFDVWTQITDRFGIDVRELYGMTELGGWVTLNTPLASRRGSVGRVRSGVRLQIQGDGGQELAVGQAGHIAVATEREHIFFEGYFRDPAAFRKIAREGWIHTGDMGYLDAEGYVYFTGRDDDVIRRGGEMISPAAIEIEILRHRAVLECGVTGVPDTVFGEEIEAVVVVGDDFDLIDFIQYIVSSIPKHMRPRYLLRVDQLPKTATEKIRRRTLPELIGERIDLSGPSLAATQSSTLIRDTGG